MPRGRKPLLVPHETRAINLPTDLLARLDLLYNDPVRGKPRYGALSKLVTTLLNEYLTDVAVGRRPPIGIINLPQKEPKP